MERPHVVIIGAGLGGIAMALDLAKAQVRITLIDRNNYHLFSPLLYQVATAALTEEDIAYPVRFIFRTRRNTAFRMGEVTEVNLQAKQVTIADGEKIGYDYLVVASGSMTNYFGMRSLSENALAMKDLNDGVKIRKHILSMFEKASRESDPDRRRAVLTFVIVGGGPTGVETAGSLADLIYGDLSKGYYNLDVTEARIVLAEASDAVLPHMPPDLQKNTTETLAGMRVEVQKQVQVVDYDGMQLVLKDGKSIPAGTVIWAAGVRAASLADKIGVRQDRQHRIFVNQYLQLPDMPQVFVIGDAAHFVQDDVPLPMTGQVAMRQGKATAQNLMRAIKGEPLRPFIFKSMGDFAVIGRNAAVGKIGRCKFKGYLAWQIWVLIHIIRLTGFRNRILVFIKWLWTYITRSHAEQIIK